MKMMQKQAALALAITSALAGSALAQPIIDGTRDAVYTSNPANRFGVQTVETGFGNNASELNNAYYTVAGNKLYFFLGGNLESNFNKLVIFLDTKTGGQNVMANNNPNVDFDNLNRRYNGMTFDTGFAPDYTLFWSRNANDIFVNFAELNTTGGGLGGYMGNVPTPNPSQQGSATIGGTGGLPTLELGYSDANVLGVGGGNGPAADQAAADAVSTGTEFAIDLDAFDVDSTVKVMIGINGSSHDFWSNQFLPGLQAPQSNLGGDGAGNFVTIPGSGDGWVGPTNFNAIPGDQFATLNITVPTYTWDNNTSGNWTTATNWSSDIVPNGSSARAVLGPAIAASSVVTVDAPITVQRLTINSPNSYTIAGTNTLTINGTTSINSVDVLAGSHSITAPVSLLSDTRVGVATGSSLTVDTFTASSNNRSLFKSGAGTLVVKGGNTLQSVTVDAGTVSLAGTGQFTVKGLTVATGAGNAFELANSQALLTVNYDAGFSPLAVLKTAITEGRLVAANPGSNYGIGYIDSAIDATEVTAIAPGNDADTLVFRRTLKGDANLDGTVGFPDLLRLAAAYNQTTGMEWYNGDFDLNGGVGFQDLLALAATYNLAASVTGSFNGDWSLAQSIVPEPTTLALAAAGGLVALRRRRR
jgi:hypothetical protein